MPAVPFIMAAATASGVAASIGAATAALVGATVTGAAAAAIGAGVLSAGVGLAQGKSISDSLKGAVIGGVASFIGAGIASDITGSIVEAAGGASASGLTTSLAKIAGDMAGGAARGAIGAGLSGQDPIDALIKGGLTAGLTSGVMEGIGGVTNEIPGFKDLKENFGDAGVATQRAITSALAAGVLGKDVGDAVTQSVLGSFAQGFGSNLQDNSNRVRYAYDNINNISESLQENVDRQNSIAEDYNTKLAAAQGLQTELQEKYNKYLEYSQSGYPDDIEAANALAEEINRDSPKLEAQAANLKSIAASLDNAKTEYVSLEKSFEESKVNLNKTIEEFKEQEETNANIIKQKFEDTVEAKEEAEEIFGSDLTKEQVEAIAKTADPKLAMEDLIKSLEGKDEDYKKSVFDKLDEGFDKAINASLEGDFQYDEIQRLKGLGYTKEQVQGYLGTTEDLSRYFREPAAQADVVDQLKDAGLKEEDLPYLPTDDDFVPTSEIEKPEEEARDIVDQLLDSEAPNIQDTTGLDEGPMIPVSGEPTTDIVDQLLNSGMPSPDEDFVPTLPAETQTPTGPGYYDEITGEFIPDENGGLQGPLGPETGNFDPNQEWEYSITRPGVWTNKEGEEIDLSYMPDRDTAMTGAELMERAGASPGAFRSGIRPPQSGGSGGAAPRPGGQPRPPVGGQPRPPTAGQPRPTTGGGAGGAGAVAGIIGGILGGGAGGVNAGDPRNPPVSRNPAVDTIAGLASQQQQNSMLNMMMNDKSEGAKIKSYKELFGEGLFGDTYVPPSARGYEPAQQPQFQSQDDDIEQFFRGGDVTDIDTLLQILRS
jgi:hypothetical protein